MSYIWGLNKQLNHPPVLSKSVTPSRIIANKTIVDLSDEDLGALSAIDKTAHFRVCSPAWTGWGNLGFADVKE